MNNPFTKVNRTAPFLIGDLSTLGLSFVPDSLPHRESQIEYMVSLLETAVRGTKPSNIILFGKTGTGKTSTARHVTSMLTEAVEDRISVSYINCQIYDSPYSILITIAQSISVKADPIPPLGWPLDRVYNEILRRIRESKRDLIIILDEIDKLTQKNGGDSLYVLLKLCEDQVTPFVSVIGITNNNSFIQELDARVRSRLSQESVVFNPYNASELRDILNFRVKGVVREDLMEPSVINLCAAIGAQEHGDARKALDLLRISIETAIRETSERVSETHVIKARAKLETDILMETVNGLPLHSKLVLLGVIVSGEMENTQAFSGEIMENYRNICKELGYTPLTSRRFGDLISDLGESGLVITKIKNLGRHGRTRMITVADNPEVIKRCLLEDDNLRTFRGVHLGKQARFTPYGDDSKPTNEEQSEIDNILDADPERPKDRGENP
ncbi:MAG: orc1/cdc6 family replication initiation protein [Candidatus Thermoplasmatota archaeon]|jgi:cell division control protein 6|nr:orc1/cdc6 family replication initiation protein [Candidatus Thermoplasmatota archaeon]MCL5794224.1 orc1/cdc6 family replication initiation protein [Candidatus Thermoplasmatota archaeon]